MTDTSPGRAPLDGLLVADFSHGVAGPFATMYLADMGADVIKIERPGRGDASRYMTVSSDFAEHIPHVGGDYYLSINRNKRSAAVDLKTDQGRRLALDLASRADVLVENFSPGVMARLGLGYDDLRETNPGLIYCSIKAFRPDSALAEESSMDVAIQAYSGLMSITGEPGGRPVKPGSSLADLSAGLHAFAAITTALYARGRDDAHAGQFIDIALLDSTMAMLTNYSVPMLDSDVEIGPIGSGHPQLVPFQAFQCKSGWIVIAAGTNGRWRKLCALLGLEHLQDDERFRRNDDRVRNRDELVPLIEQALVDRDADEWMDLMRVGGVPAAPIRTLRAAFNDPDLERTGSVLEVVHPVLGKLRLMRNAIRLRGMSTSLEAPPVLGADTRTVLTRQLGVDSAELDALFAAGIVAEADV
jgi:crotonobetainyl-CoA:carnitine CoA-transferase CaiB-like acyl-CoA transferase